MRKTSIFALAMLVLGTACGEETESGLVIGALVDQTGSNSETSWVQAAQLAVRQMNDALTAEGEALHFVLDIDDSENDAVKAQTRAVDLVNTRGARALIADTTRVTESIGRLIYTNQIDVPVQCSSCESRDFLNPAYVDAGGDTVLQSVRTDPRGTLFRTTMSTDTLAYVAYDILSRQTAGFDRNGDNFVKFELYGSDEAFGHAAVSSLVDAAQILFASLISADIVTNRFGIEQVFHNADTAPNKVDYERDLAEMRDTDIVGIGAQPDTHVADYIIVASYAGYAAAFREVYSAFQTQTLPTAIYFPNYRQSNTLAQLGNNADKTQGISPLVAESNDAGTTFTTDFRAAYGFEPHFGDAGYYDNAITLMLAAVLGGNGTVDSTTVTSAAIRSSLAATSSAGGTRVTPGIDGLRAAIRTVRAGGHIDYDGASGPLDYDAAHNVNSRITQFTAQGGEFVDVGAPFDCVATNGGNCGIAPFSL